MLLVLKMTTNARFKPASEKTDERYLSIDWHPLERLPFAGDFQEIGGCLRIATWWRGVRRYKDWSIGAHLSREKAVELAHVIARDFEERGGRASWQPPPLEEIERRVG